MMHARPTGRILRTVAFILSITLAVLASLLTTTPASAATPTATIMEIQGPAHLSPLVGEAVVTRGVVTAVAFGGFYAQDVDGDDDLNTSDGIVVSSDSTVSVGDEVEIDGIVEEDIPGGADTGNLSVTRIVGDAIVLSSGNALPEAVEIGKRQGQGARRPPAVTVISDGELPTDLTSDPATFNPETDGIDFYETLEGMYVEIDQPTASSATRQFGEFSSEVVTVPSRGGVTEPRDARTGRGGILLQPDPDNRGDQNPERVQIQFDGTIYPADVPAIQVGDRLDDVRGVVGYSFGNYEVNATEEVTFGSKRNQAERSTLRPTAKRVSVASYNVLNLSADASDDAQRAKLAEQLVENLRSPDVVALQEIQDNSGEADDGVTEADETLSALITAIETAGGPSYAAFDVAPADGASGGIPGGNIRNAFLYNPERVDLIESFSLTPAELADRGVGDPSAFEGTRDPLVGVFEFDGRPFTVVNNHLTSRFGSSPIYGGPQPFVQAGEAEREAQVGALNEFADGLLAAEPNANIMVVGDFNTFEWTNDLTDILAGEDGALTNLLTDRALNGRDRGNRYTFIFDGNSQALDHFFVNDELLGGTTGFDIVHTNVDFSRLDSDVVASDHEPIVGRFAITSPPRPPQPDDTFRLQLLHASDLEGGVDALDRAGNFAAIVDRLEDESDSEVDGTGIDASITLSAGDNYLPGPFFNASADAASFRDSGLFNDVYNELFGVTEYDSLREEGGRVDISIMNIVGFDASAVGNHEWDSGSDAYGQIIAEDFRDPAGPSGDRWVGAQFPYLSANLDFSGDADIGERFTSSILPSTDFATGPDQSASGAIGTPKLAPATFVETDQGERIGIVGATTPLLETISSPTGTTTIGPDSNDMPALAAVIQPQVDALAALEIDKIVLVSHLQQIALETELSSLLTGVDIIVAGGSGTLLANADDPLRQGDTAGEQYPVISADSGGNPTLIVSTDGEYSYVGRLVVDFDAEGLLIGATGDPVTSLDDLDLTINGPIKTEDEDVTALWGDREAAFADGTKAEKVQRLVDAVRAVVTAKDGNVVGETSVFLDGRRESVRTEETNFGNLSADANLAIARDAEADVDLSIKNGGGIRAAIGEVDAVGNLLPPQANPLSGKLDGQISQLDIENTLRFNNGLTLLTVTAAELQAIVEHAVAATEPGATPGQFAQIGGARFTFDPTQPAGSRVISLDLVDAGGTVTDGVIAGGAPVDGAATYRIVTLDFLAGGGDDYPFPDLALPSTDVVQLGEALSGQDGAVTFADPGSEQDALAEFLIANHGIDAGSPFDQAETDPADDTRVVDVTQ